MVTGLSVLLPARYVPRSTTKEEAKWREIDAHGKGKGCKEQKGGSEGMKGVSDIALRDRLSVATYDESNWPGTEEDLRTFALGESFWLPLAKKPPPLAPPPVV